jgi:COMPASS component SWD3
MPTPDFESFPADDPQLVGHDLVLLIVRFLRKRGLLLSARTLLDEVKALAPAAHASARKVQAAALDGDWETLRELGKRAPSRLRRGFLYAVSKQEFFELVDRQESQLAFALLNRRLKPLEAQCTVTGDDFKELAYLTTCRSVRDAPAFREWCVGSAAHSPLAGRA